MITRVIRSWTTEPSGRVVAPTAFGDFELNRVEMSNDSITLSLLDHGSYDQQGRQLTRPLKFEIVCLEPTYLKLRSEALQNVVEDIWIIESEASAKAFTTFSGKRLFPDDLSEEANFYLFITPIVGVEMFIAARDVQLYELDDR